MRREDDWIRNLWRWKRERGGERKDDTCKSCTLHVRVKKQNCMRVGPVRCYFTSSNCRYKQQITRQVARLARSQSVHTLFVSLDTFFQFYFISVHQQECLIVTFACPPARLSTTDQSAKRYRDRKLHLGWVRNELSTPFELSHQRRLDFTDR